MMTGKSCMLQGATIAADFGSDQLFERGNKKFGKFFLISAASNMNRWRVEPHTIPERLRTFVGRPFISEPGLAHFGAEKMSTDQIVKKQEEYAVGTIKDVVMKEDGTSFAVVEFKDTDAALKVWNDMKKGRAIYTSPAVTGYAHMEGSQKVFHDWFGLHLARVGDPAFGVFHASLKETCEGDEATCVRNLIASAAVIMNSSHVASESNNQSMMTNNEKNATAMTEEEMKKKKELEDKVAALTTQLAALTDKVNSQTSAGSERTKGSEGQTTPVTDAISPNETQSGKSGDEVVMPKGAQASALEKNPLFQKMQTQLAAYEARDKQAVIDQIIDMSATAGMITEETEIAERERLSKLSLEKLQETASVIEAPIKKMVELAARFGEDLTRVNDGSRLVKMPQTGTASTQKGNLPRKLSDCRTEWWK